MGNDQNFAEWMVSNALYRFLGECSARDARIDWLLDKLVRVPEGTASMSDACGFARSSQGFGLACETGLKFEDRGPIPDEAFRSTYWGIRPDVRLWANQGSQQLIIELKGRGPNQNIDPGQARRYFSYLRDRQATGAVVYLVPEWPEEWLQLLKGIASNQPVRFGVIQWNDEFLRPMYPQLVEVISESLVSTADFLKKALALRLR